MKLRTGLSSGLACAVVLGGLALAEAQQERSRTQVRTQERTRTTHEVRRVSAVVGGHVEFASGGSIGTIEDIVISDTGCIEYIVVSYRDRFVPIPWTVATVRFDDRLVLVDISEERFKEVPTFTKGDFSVFTKAEFTDKVHKSFNADRETRRSFGPDRKPDGATKSKDSDRKSDRGKAEDRPKNKDEDSKKNDSKSKESDKKDRPKDSDQKAKDKDKDKDKDKPDEKDRNKPQE